MTRWEKAGLVPAPPLAGEGREGGQPRTLRLRYPLDAVARGSAAHPVMNTSPSGMFWNVASGTEKLLASSGFGFEASHCVSEISS